MPAFKIHIQHPDNFTNERHYIYSVIFCEFLGIDINLTACNRRNVLLTIENNFHKLYIDDSLFSTFPNDWLQPLALPLQPLKIWNLDYVLLPEATVVNSKIPVIFGSDPNDPNFYHYSDLEINLGLDIFGSAFFMLTRYEEFIKSERDRHNRFPATASLAYQEGFLDRPIINEYIEILWVCLKQLWPRLERKPRQFNTYLSHDVDWPFKYVFSSYSDLIRDCARNIINRKPNQMFSNLTSWLAVKLNNHPNIDSFNTFDLIMDISDENGLKSTFHFICDHTAKKIDGNYSITHPLIRELLRTIHKRGHEIGLHPSYNSYNCSNQIKKELKILKKVCLEEGINQKKWGSRQHFLRWETPSTFQHLQHAGLDYDTTLSFADIAGFRCGICFEFTPFDIVRRQPLKLKERPLIIMECTILDPCYMNLGTNKDRSFQVIAQYKHRCQLFNGDFTMLWHNHRFVEPNEMDLYYKVVAL